MDDVMVVYRGMDGDMTTWEAYGVLHLGILLCFFPA